MKNKTYVVLILAILALGTVFLLKRPTRVVEISYTLPDWQLPVDTSRVVKIGIRRGPAAVSIERKHGTWKRENGEYISSDGSLVNRLLKGVADFRLLGLVSSNPRKQDLFNVGESGTTITVGMDDGKEISLVVGKMTSLPSRSYVRPATSDMVYLARGLTPDVIEGEAFGGLRRTTFHIDSSAILMISVEMGPTTVTVHRQGRTWISTEAPIPEEQISPVLRSLEEINADQIGEWTPRNGEMPLLTVDVLEQKRVRLDFYPGRGSDSSYTLRTSLSPDGLAVDVKAAQPFLKLVSFALSQQALATQQQAKPIVQQPPVPTPRPSIAQGPKRAPTGTPKPVVKQPVAAQRPRTVPKRTTETASSRSLEDEGVLSVHVVRQGETLESIARQYNVTREQIMQWNLLTGDDIRPGTELYVFVRK